MNRIRLLAVVLGVFLFAQVQADVKLPRIFSSNMVLQQGIEIPVWGWADKGERITVTLDKIVTRTDKKTGDGTRLTLRMHRLRTTADNVGNWKVQMPSMEYGGPFVLTIKGKNTIRMDNVMIGEVWICSGQSNMEWKLINVKNGNAEVMAANYPNIRLFTVPRRVAQFPEEDLAGGQWEECSSSTVPSFSAVGYFFGRELHEELKVPIGLINSSWGGTVAESWTSPVTIQNDPDFKTRMNELQQLDLENQREKKMQAIKTMLGGEIPDEDLGIQDGKAVWSAPDLDDKDWKIIIAPGLWEEQGYIDIDGVAWYRKELYLTEDQTQTNLTLHLGKVDDADITFLNGIEIGQTEQYDKERVYTIDKKYLQPGKNMIVVRVNDTGGGGGIWGDPQNQYVAIGQEKVDISGDWKFKIAKASIASVDIGPNSYPTLLYNGMISPLVPFGVKGAIWYQGESNASRAKQYKRIFPNLIEDWRQHWKQDEFSFLYVMLANFREAPEQPVESEWAELREAQISALKLPLTGLASAIDIGEAGDIHPRNKQDVGKRLALNAFKLSYGKDVVNSGPVFESVEFRNGKAIVKFREVGSGLMVKDKYGYVKAFTMAGADQKFHWAKAKLLDEQTVEVGAELVSDPVAVRFGCADNPDDLNLFNKEGLPALPFRTDNWPGITK